MKAPSTKALASIVVTALFCLIPSLSAAQAKLPIQWFYSPISQMSSVAFSPNGAIMAVGGVGGVQLYSAPTDSLLTCLPTASYTINSLAFSPDGTTLAVCGQGDLELWNASTDKLIKTLSAGNYSGALSAAFSPDGSMLAVVGYNYDITTSGRCPGFS